MPLRRSTKSARPLRAHHLDAHVVLAARLLPAVAEEPGAVGVLVDDGEVVVDVAVLRAGAHLPAAHADGLDRVLLLHDPGADVEEVDVLLDVEVARQPGEVVPVAHLVSHVGPARLPRLVPAAAAVVVGQQRDDLADRAVVDAPDRLAEAVVVAQAQARDDREALRLRPARSVSSTERTPGASTATGFSAKTCLPASTAACRCSGRKCGGVQSSTTSTPLSISLLVGVEADEAALGGDVDLGRDRLVLLAGSPGCSRAGPRRRRPWRRA